MKKKITSMSKQETETIIEAIVREVGRLQVEKTTLKTFYIYQQLWKDAVEVRDFYDNKINSLTTIWRKLTGKEAGDVRKS